MRALFAAFALKSRNASGLQAAPHDEGAHGYIVDYKDLFKKVENAIAVYTSELDRSAGGADPQILLKDRLTKGRECLDNALEAVALLCEPVERPKSELEHIHYFCGNTEIPDDLKAHEPQRAGLYKATAALVRAFANIADDLERAGYSDADIKRIAELAKKVQAGQAEHTPVQLNTPGRRALYNNLRDRHFTADATTAADPGAPFGHAAMDPALNLAMRIDSAVKHVRPDGWRGVQARELVIKGALYGILQNQAEVERIFLIIKQQREY